MYDQTWAALGSVIVLAGGSAMLGVFVVAFLEIKRLHDIDVRRRMFSLAILFVCLGILGAAAGLAGGQSRVGVVGDIYSAAFVFMGGGAAYLFGIDASRGGIVALCCAVFGLSLFAGFHNGAVERGFDDEQRELRSACMNAMADGQLAAQAGALEKFTSALTYSRKTVINGESKVVTIDLCEAVMPRWSLDWTRFDNWRVSADN